MQSIFEPIMVKIIELVKEQIKDMNRTIRAVLLLGGFDRKNHLKERLSELEVLQPLKMSILFTNFNFSNYSKDGFLRLRTLSCSQHLTPVQSFAPRPYPPHQKYPHPSALGN
jgi:hypothetical protein